MKRVIYSLLCGLAALALSSCSTEFIEPVVVPQPEGAIAINISGSVNQEYTTRVDDGGFCDGDQVGLFGVNYSEDNTLAGELLDEGNQVDNARYTFDETNWKWVSSGNIYYKDAETNIDLYGYYPYANVESVNAYKIEVAQDQSGNNTIDGYAQSDFLWGKATNITPTEQKIKILFNHKMACANVILAEGEGWAEGEFAALNKGLLVMSTKRNAEIDLSTGVATAVGDVESEGIVMKQNAEGFRAIVVPQTVAAGNALFTITVDGITYRFKHDADFTYEAGKQSKFTISIKKKSMSGELEFELLGSEITPWVADLDSHGGEAKQYYCVHLDEAGTLEAKIKADGKNPAKIKNLKVSGQICGADFYFMRDNMDILQAVNLKETEIVGFWGCYILTEEDGLLYVFLPGDMPASHDECEQAVRNRYPDKNITDWNNCEMRGLANEIPHSAFYGKYTLTTFVFPEVVTKIESYAFQGTTLSGALVIPDDVEIIGDDAFSGTNISSLQLPHSLKTLEYEAFADCSSLAGSLYLPESLESIGERCFYRCSMLSGTLRLPEKLTEIPFLCFTDCSGLTGDLIIPEGVKSIGQGAFARCSGLTGRLSLPNSLTKIENEAFASCSFQGELYIPPYVQIIPSECFSYNEFSSVIFAENSELIKIETSAFLSNWRFGEPVKIPDGVLTIGNRAFERCSTLPSVTLPVGVTTIGSGAFRNCYSLTKLSCEATMPPVVGSGAFDGVAKDNFTLQVPEASVSLYQTATGWSDFKSISPYYDFSISRKHIRALNAEYSKEYILRVPSGEKWSVASCPEWVTVTPSSGVGRSDVVVTLSEMPRTDETFTLEEMDTYGNWTTETHKGRAGEIVFQLDDITISGDGGEKVNCTVSMAVEQYDSDRYDGEVIVNQSATVGGGVNLVFMGDCFDARDIAMGSYLDGVNKAIEYYFAIEPYKHYRDHFNVYTVLGMSVDSGMGTVNTIKEAKFDSQYSLDGITPDVATTYEYAMLCDTVEETNLNQTLVVMVENTTDYGGITYMWADGSAIAICPMSADAYPFDFRGIVQHEAGGHGFAKLADEYIYHNAFIQSCVCQCCPHLDGLLAGKKMGWYRNVSENGSHKTVEWAHLIEHPDYSNIVDMYEGAYFHTRGVYRSEANSCMNNNVPYYSAISRQEMVERIMRYGGLEFSLEDFYANDVRDASNNDFTTASVSCLSAQLSSENIRSASKQMPPKFMGEKPQLKK